MFLVSLLVFFFFFPFLFLPYGPRVSERTSRICTRTSVQVAIGLFPIDSVHGQFLFPTLGAPTCSLHLPFTLQLYSLFPRSSRGSSFLRVTAIAFLSVSRGIDTIRIKETVYWAVHPRISIEKPTTRIQRFRDARL